MRSDVVGGLTLVLMGLALACIWAISRAAGVSMESVGQCVLRLVLVTILLGAASWITWGMGRGLPWPFAFPGVWWALWPAVQEKASLTPESFIVRGMAEQFLYWGSPYFLWTTLVVGLVLAAAAWWLWICDRN